MMSDRLQRQIDRLLDAAELAITARDWVQVRACALDVLRLDPANRDALAFVTAAEREPESHAPAFTEPAPSSIASEDLPAIQASPSATLPSSFAAGRYLVKRFLGEGGKKKVYLAHDTLLDRDVAFALIKTEGLDDAGRARITREAQAMGRLGSHPHIVSVFDLGEEAGGQPFIVTELMGGGDVEGLVEKAEGHRPPLRRTLAIGQAVSRGLAFAHAQGIVHRDLKPGNVWLTADGVAKIGDFGLAVSLDKSRLTQQGMMVGTVSYMPPEQALGGAVTPRADLYSLGAMLYELVTGRPPFLGDDAIAIISQHVNTAPVAPSWHNPAVPPALEGMILRLLAKAASERPASAAEVLTALEAIDPDAPVAALSSANPLERLARGVFVGRERELSRLRAAFDDANAGRGGVVMLVGEPGIGKTRTAQELEMYARIRGGQVLWGRAHEAAGAPAFWPWVQALRAYVGGIEPTALSTQLGSGAVEVARIVTEVRERLPGLPEPPASLEPEAAQFRLFDAIASFLKNAATATPLLLVLDDLHWADKPTLLLLQHVARELGRSRILVVGTYRDVEVGRTHPLAAVLAELQRDALFQRVLLRGLSPEEVEAYIRASARIDPARELLATIYQETEGNPFFLAEVVALLVQEGTLQPPGAARRGTAIAVPQSVREVLGRRLDRLSPECNALLTIAAVAGREFRYDLLTMVSDHDDVRLLALVEEAIEGRVIGETEPPGAYRFSHALVQETLLGELSTTRRVRLHGQVAEALEGLYGDRAEHHAAELAQHFVESATLTRAHAGKAVRYSKLAAQQAEAATAWEEAARHYEHCLTLVTAADDHLGEDEAALLLALGRCYRFTAEWRAAWRSLMRAITAYRERGDGVGMARATLEAGAILGVPRERFVRLVEEVLAVLGEREPRLSFRLLQLSAGEEWDGTAMEAARRAEELGRFHGYPEVALFRQRRAHFRAMEEGRFDDMVGSAQTLADAYEQAGEHVEAVITHRWVAIALLMQGQLDACETAAVAASEAAHALHLRVHEQESLSVSALVALLRGDVAHFDSLAQEVPGFYFLNALLQATRMEWTGDCERALALVPSPETDGPPWAVATFHAMHARLRFHGGDEAGARQALAACQAALAATPRFFATWIPSIYAYIALGACLPVLGDAALVETAYRELSALPQLRLATSDPQSREHLRGALALRLGLIDEADGHFRSSLEWAERERCPVEQGRCLQGLAEVAERRGQHGEAAGYLDRAAALFQQLGATLYLRQVLAKKEILKA